MSPMPPSTAREEILRRIRDATGDVRGQGVHEAAPIPRDYLTAHVHDGLIDLLAENLADYRAEVHRCTEAEIPDVVARLLSDHGDRSAAVPEGLPETWLARVIQAAPDAGDEGDEGGEVREARHAGGVRDDREADAAGETPFTFVPDSPDLTAHDLDAVDAVVSACALAIAETGTIVLDAGPGQGRRMLTLVPDHHICVVRCPEQVVASVPQALPRLDPTRPQTWIAGPSATSDIELDRVEGVHGPRRLDVVLVEAATEAVEGGSGADGSTVDSRRIGG